MFLEMFVLKKMSAKLKICVFCISNGLFDKTFICRVVFMGRCMSLTSNSTKNETGMDPEFWVK